MIVGSLSETLIHHLSKWHAQIRIILWSFGKGVEGLFLAGFSWVLRVLFGEGSWIVDGFSFLLD